MPACSPTIEEAWFATVKTLPGNPRPQVVTVSKDATSLEEHAADLASVNKRATYSVIPVMLTNMDGVRLGDEVRVVTPDTWQAMTGHVTEIRDGIAKVRYGSGRGINEVPIQHLKVVSRWVRFDEGASK